MKNYLLSVILLLFSLATFGAFESQEFPENQILMTGIGALTVPTGDTASRPSPVTNGMIRYNTDLNTFEMYSNAAWETPVNNTAFLDGTFIISNTADNTKKMQFDASSITTGTTRSYVLPDSSGIFALLGIDQTFTGVNTFSNDILMIGTGQIQIPAGTTAQRSGTPVLGMLRYNTDINDAEIYNGVSWVQVGGSSKVSGGGSSTDNAISRWDGVTGLIIQDSNVIIDDDGKISQTGLSNSTIIGTLAGQNDDLTSNTMTAIGYQAGRDNATGIDNTSLGFQAGMKNTASSNTMLGAQAMENSANSSASGNVVVGDRALQNANGSSVKNNTAIGHFAQRVASNIGENTSVGAESLENNITGGRNVTIGYKTGTRVLSSSNVAVGTQALGHESGGSMARNIAIGDGAGLDMRNGTDNILIGDNVEAPSGINAVRDINIGDYIIGNMDSKLLGIGVLVPTVALDIDGAIKATGDADFLGDMTSKTLTTTDDVIVGGIGQIKVPEGTTAQRSAIPLPGMIRFNSDLAYIEGYNGVAWVQMETGAAASGDVVGPLTATDNAIARYDLATGKIIQDSGVIIDDTDNVSGIVNLTVTGTTTLNTSLNGIITATAGVLTAGAASIDLTTDVTGILPIANGGTNSSTALTNNKVIISTAGALVESATTTTQLGFLDATSSIQTQLDGKFTLAGESGGQVAYGGLDAGDDLQINSTAHATKGDVFIDGINVKRHILTTASTGMYTGGTLSINVDTTKFDLAATTGHVIDSTTDPLNPTEADVTFAGATAQTVTNIATNEFTHIYLTSAGAILQSVVEPTPQLRRDNIYIGKLIHPDNINVTVISNQPEVLINPTNMLVDYWRALGLIVTSGNRISANGANLSMDRSSGNIHQDGVNYSVDKKQPNLKTLAADIGFTFRLRTQTSVETGDVTVIDPTVYDNAGVVTAIAGSNNQATNIRVYLFQTGNIRVQYGQQIYSNLASAIQGINTEPFILEPNIADNAVLLSVMSVQKGATDLSNTAQANIAPASKFGEIAAGTGASAVSTLQDAYDNSSQPQITLDGTLGGVQVLDNVVPIAAPLLEVLDTTALINYFTVDASSVSTVSDILMSGTGQIDVPSGTTAQRSGTPNSGMIRFNTTTSAFEGYDGTLWGNLGGDTSAITTQGDLLVGNVTGDEIRLPIGVSGRYLKSDGTTASWEDLEGLTPLMAKGSLFSSNGVVNGEFSACANGEMLEWDSTQTAGFKCVTSAAAPVTVTKTTTATLLTSGEDNVILDATTADFTVTLPTAVGNSGLTYKISKETATNVVTIDADGAETIAGALTVVMPSKDDSIIITSDGTEWFYLSDDIVYSFSTGDTSGQTINSSLSALTFNTINHDTHGGFSSNTYTIPISGKYSIFGTWLADMNLSTIQAAQVRIYVNGSERGYGLDYGGGSTQSQNPKAYAVLDLILGDLITIQALSPVTGTSNVNAYRNTFSAQRTR